MPTEAQLRVGEGGDVHYRLSNRLRGYDYTQAGAYFVTICLERRERWFGQVVDGAMVLSDAGRIAESAWRELPGRFPGMTLDEYAIMPDHVHGIVVLAGPGKYGVGDYGYGAGEYAVGAQSHGVGAQ